MNNCPCCSGQLLRHARHSGVYWFCPHCYQEMPNLSAMIDADFIKSIFSIQLVPPSGTWRQKVA